MKQPLPLTLVLFFFALPYFGEAKAAGFEKVCEVRVDREIADVYIQEVGMWRRQTGPNKWETKIGVKIYDIFKSCFILSPRANVSLTVKSSSGGHATGGIYWNPSEHLKGSWAFKTFNNLYLKDCGGGFHYHVESHCK